MDKIYDSNKPFVFISYAHKDTAKVLPIIEALAAKGISLWYDAGIAAGSEWPEFIAAHLKACACTLCFISPNYDHSDNCRRELTYALNHKRPTMSVYLEACQLSDGLELQLGLVQAVFCDRFSTTELLAAELVTIPMIAACFDSSSEIPAAITQARRDAAEAAFLKKATINNGVLEKYFGDESEIQIPCSVTQIGKQAFFSSKTLVSVTIPDSVVRIDEYAFAYCKKLTSVTLSDGVAYMGAGAFAGCEALTAIAIPNGVPRLEEWTFASCEALTTLSIPNSVTGIGRFAFSGCKNLTSVTIPDSVTSIEWDAFNDCSALSSVTLPGSLNQIDGNPFTSCRKLTGFSLSGDAPHLTVKNGHLIDTRTKTLIAGSADAPIPDDGSVEIIGKAAFSGSRALTSLVIPHGVTTIERNAFDNCKELTSAILPESLRSIGHCAFSGAEALTSVNLPSGVTTLGFWVFSNCEALLSITIPSSIVHIDHNPFMRCNNLTEITVAKDNPNFIVKNGHLIDTRTKTLITGRAGTSIPDDGSVTIIGNSAFSGCTALTSAFIPSGVTSIGQSAFSYCKELGSVSIPESVVAISPNAFESCNEATIFTRKNSFAWNWAESNHVRVQDDTEIKLRETAWRYRNAGLCQHCGGTFKGLFRKKCASCRKQKDY